MAVPTPRIMLIGSENPTTWIVYNHIIREFGLCPAIIEQPVPRSVLLKNRARKLGWLAVLGQMLFVALIRPLLQQRATARLREIAASTGLEAVPPETAAIRHVENINAPDALELLRQAKPDVVVVNGTRILKRATLQATKAVFLNTHQGMTPRYRGAHGAYWALYQNDPQHCGVTVHVVDEGIDTGAIVAQARIEPTPKDNFATYPYLQTAAALPLLTAAVAAVLDGSLATHAVEGPSAVWYHPGILQYLWALRRGVR